MKLQGLNTHLNLKLLASKAYTVLGDFGYQAIGLTLNRKSLNYLSFIFWKGKREKNPKRLKVWGLVSQREGFTHPKLLERRVFLKITS